MAKIPIQIHTGKIVQPDVVVGIDLGTTNSLVAFVNPKTAEAECLGADSEVIVPSVVHLPALGEPVVGDRAKQALINHPESTIFSVKRLLGKSYSDLELHADYFTYRIIDYDKDQMVMVEANGKYFSPVQLSSIILSELKKKAESVLERPVTRAVITVPAYFNDSQRQATRDAGKLAGLDVLRIVNEPTAASLAYGLGLNVKESRTVLVYDLGGGTFDVSILRIDQGIFEVLSTHGDTYLGGDDIDRGILNHWLQQLDIEAKSCTRSEIQALRLNAEEAKKQLNQGLLSFELDFHFTLRNQKLSINQAEFQEILSPLIAKTLQSVQHALKDASLSPTEVDDVILVGGSTRLSRVKTELANIFGTDKINDSLNPDEVVALGAAIEADILAGNRRDLLLLDITPLSLGIETAGGLMDVLIPRNSKIPGKAARQYTTSVDGQVNLKISVYQGERELVSENRKLGEFELRGIPAMPAGLPKVEIGFLVNTDGILTVSAVELRSGVKQEISIKPQYGLTDNMVEQMLEESLLHAKSDIEMRQYLEAKTEGKQLMDTAERFISKNQTLLSQIEIEHTHMLMSQLSKIIDSGTRDEILGATDALNEYTRPFAERLMDAAVGQALKGTIIK